MYVGVTEGRAKSGVGIVIAERCIGRLCEKLEVHQQKMRNNENKDRRSVVDTGAGTYMLQKMTETMISKTSSTQYCKKV